MWPFSLPRKEFTMHLEGGGGERSGFWSVWAAVSLCIWIEAAGTKLPTSEWKAIWVHQGEEGKGAGVGRIGGEIVKVVLKWWIMEFRGYHHSWNGIWGSHFHSVLNRGALLMWFIKQLSQSRPWRQMHSMGCEEEIPVEADIATGFNRDSPAASLFMHPLPTP